MVFVFVAVSAAVMQAKPVSAATNGVTVYFHNTVNWKQVYCYTWQGTSATGKAWPGTEMTNLGNGWYSFTYTGTKALNVVFNDNGKPKTNQTADYTPKDLPLTQSAYWFVPGTSSQDNANGMGGGVTVTVYKTAEAGWPTPTVASTTTTKSTTTTTKTTVTDNTPKTGDNNTVYAVGAIGLVSLIAMCAVFGKKKIHA